MIKVTTSHGTYYLIDPENHRAKRFPADGRGHLRTDDGWFHFSSWSGANVGDHMFFNVINNSFYDWQRSTPVVSVEDIEDES